MTQRIEHARRVESLDGILAEFKRRRLLLVADKVAYEQSGARQRLESSLSKFAVSLFNSFSPNPKIEDVGRGVELLNETSADVVVAVGGGTSIDVAKLICYSAAQGGPLLQTLQHPTRKPAARRHPFVAIPTTAGTGSEATPFAVVYVGEEKHSVSHPSLIPNAVILDPSLTNSLPPSVTAATGLDAICQAIESLWSIRATPASIRFAEEALQLGLQNFEDAVLRPSPTSREAMMMAAHLSGLAISQSQTTAPHALSYRMTIAHGVPHGIAVAIGMSAFLRFNARTTAQDIADPRGESHLSDVLQIIARAFHIDITPVDPTQIATMDLVAKRWEEMLARVGVQYRLQDWGVTAAADRDALVRSVNQQRLSNNPRQVTPDDLQRIVASIAGPS